MTVYKYFIRVALKHKFIILGYSLMFLFLSIINGTDTKAKEVQFIDTKLNIGIIDNSNSELSKGLVGYLKDKNNIIDTRDDEEYIKEQIFLQILDGVVIIPKDFDEKVVNKKEAIKVYNNDREIGSSYLEQQVNKYIVFANATYMDGQFDLEGLKTALNEKTNVKIIGDKVAYKNTGINRWFRSYYNFTSYIIIAVYVAVIGLVMTEFKDEKIENRTKVSSKKFSKFNGEIYLGQISLGAVITLVFILGSVLLKGKYIGNVDFKKYVINIIIFSFAILCLTFLINNLTGNRFIINGISTVVSLGTSFISGVMVPQEFLGEKVLAIAKFFPTYYFVRINEKDIASFMEIRYEILMQIMFGIVFLLMGLYFSRIKRRA